MLVNAGRWWPCSGIGVFCPSSLCPKSVSRPFHDYLQFRVWMRLSVEAFVFRVLVAFCLFDVLVWPTCIQHVSLLLDRARLFIRLGSSLAKCARFQLALDGDWPVAAEPLPHIDHALFALGVAFLQLLALCRERVFEGWAETIAGRVSLDHYAVAVLQAKSQRGAWIFLASHDMSIGGR